MCILKIKRTASGVPSNPLPRGQLAFDYFTNTLFVGNSTNVGIPIGREVYGETGDDLFLEDYNNAFPTQEAVKTYVDSNFEGFLPIEVGDQYLGITANRQPVALSETTDTVIEWSTATIYEQSENPVIQIYDEFAPFYEGFFQTEVDLMYVRVTYSLLLSELGEVASGQSFTADDYRNASRFCAIKLVNRSTGSFEYFGAQKVPPHTASRNSLDTSTKRSTQVNGTAIIPLPRRTPENLWEIQIVTRWKTTAPSGFLFVGGFNSSSLGPSGLLTAIDIERIIFGGEPYTQNGQYVGYSHGRSISVQLQRISI